MFVVLAIILAVAWLVGLAVYHVSSGALHLLLLCALVAAGIHIFRHRRVTGHH